MLGSVIDKLQKYHVVCMLDTEIITPVTKSFSWQNWDILTKLYVEPAIVDPTDRYFSQFVLHGVVDPNELARLTGSSHGLDVLSALVDVQGGEGREAMTLRDVNIPDLQKRVLSLFAQDYAVLVTAHTLRFPGGSLAPQPLPGFREYGLFYPVEDFSQTRFVKPGDYSSLVLPEYATTD